jgi:hypothetical protein
MQATVNTVCERAGAGQATGSDGVEVIEPITVKPVWYIQLLYCPPPPRAGGGGREEQLFSIRSRLVHQNKWLDGWMVGWLDGWMVGWLDGWMVGWLDGWMVGWLDGWMV